MDTMRPIGPALPAERWTNHSRHTRRKEHRTDTYHNQGYRSRADRREKNRVQQNKWRTHSPTTTAL